MKTIHLQVKELAQARGWSDLELAGRSRVDIRVVRRMWNNYQTGELLLGQLVRVAEALNVPTGTLIDDVPPSQ